MHLDAPDLDIHIPDGALIEDALRRTTHLGIGAHADDLELMAAEGILSCIDDGARWFTGIIVTDGGGSPRSEQTRSLTTDELRARRRDEQRRAAALGAYSAVIQLGFSSAALKQRTSPDCERAIDALQQLLAVTRPTVLYTHNLADKHDTHVAVALRVLEATRRLPAPDRPPRVIGCEVWRALDWLIESDKVVMPLDTREDLQSALIATFTSQITNAKRYDRAALGRRHANAVFADSHHSDRHQAVALGMDLTPLTKTDTPEAHITTLLDHLKQEILTRLTRLR